MTLHTQASLEQRMDSLLRSERASSVQILRLLLEMRRRRSYAPAGYSSLWDYCVKRFRMSEDMTAKRLHVIKVAERCPILLDAIADGRLHLTGARLLAPHLVTSNAAELIAAAAHLSCEGIRLMLAERFPSPDVVARVVAIAPDSHVSAPMLGLASAPEPASDAATVQSMSPEHASRHVSFSETAQARAAAAPQAAVSVAPHSPAPSRVEPIAPQRFAMQLTLTRETHEKLRHAQDLLGHTVPSHDLAQVLERALDALIAQLEKRRFAKTDRPRKRTSHANDRYIPADVKRKVAERDGHRCTYVSPNGVRCGCRRGLQYDHIIPRARGGKSTVENLRLRCHAHNQWEAERVFGAGFMNAKRVAARGRGLGESTRVASRDCEANAARPAP